MTEFGHVRLVSRVKLALEVAVVSVCHLCLIQPSPAHKWVAADMELYRLG